jgi:isoleucyl-tRNA synthetase
MSKSKRNYLDPDSIIDHEGADALRWYLFSANAPWNSTRFYEDAVKETLAKFILIVWNSYNFFTTYAALDNFDPMDDPVPVEQWSLLDKWMLSRFHQMVRLVRAHMQVFEIHKAARVIEQFVTDDFSNWYLRRSRKRLWVEEKTIDKKAAYASMYEIFIGLTKVIAPFTPFIAEEMYQNLKGDTMPESVHLCDYPVINDECIDEKLESGMQRIRDLVEVGRALRSKIGIKVRYPLAHAMIVCDKKVETSIRGLVGLLMEELNVKEVTFERSDDMFMNKQVKPKYAVLGPRLKDMASDVQKILMQMDKTVLFEELQQDGKVSFDIKGDTVELTIDDFEIVGQVKEGIARTETVDAKLFLDVRLSDELEAEGFAREIVRRIQSMRKEMDLAVESQIKTVLLVPKEKQASLSSWVDYIKQETRSIVLCFSEKPDGKLVKPWDIDGLKVTIGVSA